MSFTYQKTDFINLKTYNEQTHADALKNGIPNFVNDGFEYDEAASTLSSGKGINNGVPFVIGKEGEKQTVTAGYTGYLYVETSLNGFSSTSKVLEGTTVPTNTSTERYFKLWELDNGTIVQDNRHVEYIKDIQIVPVGDTGFKLNINGTLSNTFSTSTLQSGYTKTDAQQFFVWKQDIYDYLINYNDNDFLGLLLYNVQNDLTNDQVGNLAEFRKEKYALIPAQSSSSTTEENNIRTLISDLTGDISTSNIFIEWKPVRGEANNAIQNLVITYEGNGSHIYHYQTNNYVSGIPTKNSDYINKNTQYFGDVRIDGETLVGERHRSWAASTAVSFLNTGQSYTLNLKGYTTSQLEKITLVFSTYNLDTDTPFDDNVVQHQITNFASGDVPGYDGAYDTNIVSVPWYAVIAENSYWKAYIKMFNLDATGILKGASDPSSVRPSNRSYVLRSVYVTVASNHWGNPNNARMDKNTLMRKLREEEAAQAEEVKKLKELETENTAKLKEYEERSKMDIKEISELSVKLSELETAQLRMEEQLQEMETLKEQIEALRKDNNE